MFVFAGQNMFENDENVIIIKMFGLAESARNKACETVNKIDGLNLEFEENNADIRATLRYFDETPKTKVDQAVKFLINSYGDYIYSTENVSLQKCAVDYLKVRNLTLCTAESFTGGALARAIVSVEGASKVFYQGLVTYSPKAKEKMLGVSPSTISLKSVVSSEVAFEMVRGLLQSGDCDVAAATTGYASDSGNPDEPCGLCYIAAGMGTNVNVCRYRFSGSREQIMEQGKNAALFMLIKLMAKS